MNVFDYAARQMELTLEPRARVTDPETSHVAARSMKEHASAQRARIAALLAIAGDDGMTADEIDETANWRPTTAGRRLKEMLQEDVARIRMDPARDGQAITRPTRSGRPATVYVHRLYA